MFAELFENMMIRWECSLEWYLLKTDQLAKSGESRLATLTLRLREIADRPQNSRKLLQLTLSGLIIAFTILLFSCQTMPHRAAPSFPQPRRFDSGRVDRDVDQLYLRRDEIVIKNRDAGSSTGSIWADSSEPRTLLTDPAPSKEGQTVTVLIPKELQFEPQRTSSGEATSSKGDKNKTSANKNEDALKFTDPDETNSALRFVQEPIKSLKMQIVGFEPGGDVYLRGIRSFKGLNGEENSTMILAKVPRRALTSYELDARELTDIAINEEIGGKQREYSAAGWDEMVSRRLSNFAPDLKTELAQVEMLKDEVKSAQLALREQSKAIEAERERIRKERERLSRSGGGGNADATQSGGQDVDSSKKAEKSSESRSN